VILPLDIPTSINVLRVPAAPRPCQHLILSVKKLENFECYLPALLFTFNMMQLCHLTHTVPSNVLILVTWSTTSCSKWCNLTQPRSQQRSQTRSQTANYRLYSSIYFSSGLQYITQEISPDSVFCNVHW
jgi:hypothetical protein